MSATETHANWRRANNKRKIISSLADGFLQKNFPVSGSTIDELDDQRYREYFIAKF